jgi:hypothetical protein
VAARTRGDVLSLSVEWIGIGFDLLHRVTGRALHGQSSGAFKDVLGEVAAWPKHHEWFSGGSEE